MEQNNDSEWEHNDAIDEFAELGIDGATDYKNCPALLIPTTSSAPSRLQEAFDAGFRTVLVRRPGQHDKGEGALAVLDNGNSGGE